MLDRVSGKGAPVATVFVSGRPLYVNKELNRSDAFVAAWLPGTEGEGVADLLVKGRHTGRGFTGTLSYSWPATPCQTPLNAGDEGYAPLFELGYGLRNGQKANVAAAAGGVRRALRRQRRRRHRDGGARAVRPPGRRALQELHRLAGQLGRHRARQRPERAAGRPHEHRGALTSDVNVQQDARKITWNGGAGQFYIQPPEADLRPYLNSDGAIVFDTIVTKAPTAAGGDQRALRLPVLLGGARSQGLPDRADGAKHTVKVRSRASTTGSLEFDHINTPFLIYTEGADGGRRSPTSAGCRGRPRTPTR